MLKFYQPSMLISPALLNLIQLEWLDYFFYEIRHFSLFLLLGRLRRLFRVSVVIESLSVRSDHHVFAFRDHFRMKILRSTIFYAQFIIIFDLGDLNAS